MMECYPNEYEPVDVESACIAIRRFLAKRQAARVSDVCQALRMEEVDVRNGLAIMLSRGEILRLRPAHYAREDRDFYRLRGFVNPATPRRFWLRHRILTWLRGTPARVAEPA